MIDKKKKSGMTVARSYALQNKFLSRALDIYNSARHFKSTHAELLERLKREVWKQVEYKRLPEKYQTYISGYLTCLLRQVYQDLEWRMCVRFPREVYDDPNPIPGLYAMDNEPFCRLLTREQIDHIQRTYPSCKDIWSWIDSDKSRHCWKNSPDRYY